MQVEVQPQVEGQAHILVLDLVQVQSEVLDQAGDWVPGQTRGPAEVQDGNQSQQQEQRKPVRRKNKTKEDSKGSRLRPHGITQGEIIIYKQTKEK